MSQKNSIFVALKQIIGRITSEFTPGFFYARKYTAYNPVPAMETPADRLGV